MPPSRPAERPRRPVYLNLPAIRLPLPGVVSILHRVSGAVLFLVAIPLALCALDASLSSPSAYASFAAAAGHPIAKLVTIGLVWAYVHHLLAGVRHLAMDLHAGLELASARRASAAVFVFAVLITLVVAVRLW
jgi:succinate dehydrogenase / fumarate reductase cytochrome b subunit